MDMYYKSIIPDIAKQLDWYNAKNYAFGLHKGYFFTLAEGQGLKLLRAPYTKVSETVISQLKRDIRTNKKKLHISRYEVKENYIEVVFAEFLSQAKRQRILEALNLLADILKDNAVSRSDKCMKCAAPENLGYYEMTDRGLLLCDSCQQKLENEIKISLVKESNAENNYFNGAFGALLFSLIGVIAWFIAGVYFNKVFGFMAFIIGFLAIKGYTIFKGKIDKYAKWILIGISLIAVLLADYFTYAGILHKYGRESSLRAIMANTITKEEFVNNVRFSIFIWLWPAVWLFFRVRREPWQFKGTKKLNPQ